VARADQSGVALEAPATGALPGTNEGALSGTNGGYIGQFDSFRVIACCAVVLQHSLLWTIAAGNTAAWAFVMLLHFSRTAFFFLAAFLLTYSQITRPRSTLAFWRRRYVQIGVPFLAWTGIYWIFTMITGDSWDQAWSLLWNYVVFGYYQLYFVVVLLLLYLVFPAVLRAVRASSHHMALMMASLLFALLLAADLHYTASFGAVGDWTRDIASKWPWARNPITYQEQFVAGILVALHWDQVRGFVERWYRQVIAGAILVGIAATMWYLVAVWTGSTPGHASDLYQPIAFLWFTAAVAALECGAWMWFRRRARRPGRAPGFFTAEFLAGLTGGVFLCHVLFINLVRSGLGAAGLTPHLGWAGMVAVTFVLTMGSAALFTALIQRTPLRWVLGGPVRAEQRARLGSVEGAASTPAPVRGLVVEPIREPARV
jgi:peptidoglycan/LPS O-acetylase OafA/YrhL